MLDINTTSIPINNFFREFNCLKLNLFMNFEDVLVYACELNLNRSINMIITGTYFQKNLCTCRQNDVHRWTGMPL